MGPNNQNPYTQYGNYSGWSPWGNIAGGLAGIFGGGGNPANAAEPYLQGAQNTIQSSFAPYIQAGQQALPTLQTQYGNLLNPNFINNFGQNFQQSPGYQWNLNQQQGAVNRAAAAGGFAGTPQEQQQMAQTTSGIANQDYYNWMDHAMNAYGMGLQGEQGLYNTGFQASSQSAEDQAQIAESQAQLAYAGQINQNQSQQGGWGALASGVGQLFGGGFGGSQGGQGGQGNYGLPDMSDFSWLADLAQYV